MIRVIGRAVRPSGRRRAAQIVAVREFLWWEAVAMCAVLVATPLLPLFMLLVPGEFR